MVLQAMSSASDVELMCDVRTSTLARSVVEGGQRRRVPRDAQDGSSSDSDSTDSFQRDTFPTHHKRKSGGAQSVASSLLSIHQGQGQNDGGLNLEQGGRWCRDGVRLQRHGMHGSGSCHYPAGSGVAKLLSRR